MAWMCKSCRAKSGTRTAPWFNQVWLLRSLQKAGYPFEKNDLTLAQWLGIAQLEAEIESMQYGK